MNVPAATLIARLVGPFFVALGVGIVLNSTFYATAVGEGAHSPVLIALSGMATLFAGIAILNAHRAWTADWRVLVTLLGWVFVIAGLIRLILPKFAEEAAPAIYSGPAPLLVAGAVVLVIGAILSFAGYRA
jgi:uncharacterized protein YjeT (DUF2065 family)